MKSPSNTLYSKLFTRLGLFWVLLSPYPAFASLDKTGETPVVTAPQTHPIFKRTAALTDPDHIISPEFHIPARLKKRTAFWFDIYTLYGSEEHVIHNSLYPWIIYRVVDTSTIAPSPHNRWAKYHKGVRLVRHETRAVRSILLKLAKRKNFRKLKPDERAIYNALKEIRGPRRKVFRIAAENVRVQLGQKDFILQGLESGSKYLPLIEQTFKDKGLPTELARLPFVESSFNVNAESKVGASGIWQIMPSTGKSLLLVSDHIDERNSPLKASLAASEIFIKNYRQLKSWPLVITAYNHGAYGLKQAMAAAHTNNLATLIDRYHSGAFGFASANFYTSFLAVLHAEKYHKKIFDDMPLTETLPLEHRVVSLEKPMSFRQLLKTIGLNADKILEYNLDLKKAAESNARLPRGYRIILPPEADGFIEKMDSRAARLLKEALLVLSSDKHES